MDAGQMMKKTETQRGDRHNDAHDCQQDGP